MDLTITKKMAEALGANKLTFLGYSEDKMKWKDDWDVDLSRHTQATAKKLRDLLDTIKQVPRVKARLEDLDRWLLILNGADQRCKKIAHWDSMLKLFLQRAPKQWLYNMRDDSEVYQPYYVSHIEYHPPEKGRDGWTSPAYVCVKLNWEELGNNHSSTLTFHEEDVEDVTVERALADSGYFVERPEFLASYEANRKKYLSIYNKVGMQFVAVGVAEEEAEKKDYWYRRVSKIQLSRDGIGSRVVVDLLHEDDTERDSKTHAPTGEFWAKMPANHKGKEVENDDDIEPGDEDSEEELEIPVPLIPLNPALMCFDLKRQTRLKIYVDQLTEYVYDTELSKKLILPQYITNLVTMLVAHKGGFKDIVGNKGGGAVILCAGPPGTGKTLTSEVYSESMQRPLYSVQCSQLGTNPEELETELLKVFARAQRWGAILLLDEADVYVTKRGSDLTQNAIVGVFLRVLEYYGGILFLTTNRADLVDDAVLSRCLARIDYKVPTPDDQARIWRTLADNAGITIADASIAQIVKNFPHLSGRDVKNLLKLASMVAAAEGLETITAKTVTYVKQFKPTSDLEE